MNALLSDNTVQLSPLSQLVSVVDQLTVISDALVRDVQFEALNAEEISAQGLEVLPDLADLLAQEPKPRRATVNATQTPSADLMIPTLVRSLPRTNQTNHSPTIRYAKDYALGQNSFLEMSAVLTVLCSSKTLRSQSPPNFTKQVRLYKKSLHQWPCRKGPFLGGFSALLDPLPALYGHFDDDPLILQDFDPTINMDGLLE